MDKLFGWTPHQWALALGHSDVEQPENVPDALRIKSTYIKKHERDPIEKATIYNPEGDTRPCDWESAYLVIEMALKHQYGEIE